MMTPAAVGIGGFSSDGPAALRADVGAFDMLPLGMRAVETMADDVGEASLTSLPEEIARGAEPERLSQQLAQLQRAPSASVPEDIATAEEHSATLLRLVHRCSTDASLPEEINGACVEYEDCGTPHGMRSPACKLHDEVELDSTRSRTALPSRSPSCSRSCCPSRSRSCSGTRSSSRSCTRSCRRSRSRSCSGSRLRTCSSDASEGQPAAPPKKSYSGLSISAVPVHDFDDDMDRDDDSSADWEDSWGSGGGLEQQSGDRSGIIIASSTSRSPPTEETHPAVAPAENQELLSQLEQAQAEAQEAMLARLDASYEAGELREQLDEAKNELKEAEASRIESLRQAEELKRQLEAAHEHLEEALIKRLDASYEEGPLRIQLDAAKAKLEAAFADRMDAKLRAEGAQAELKVAQDSLEEAFMSRLEASYEKGLLRAQLEQAKGQLGLACKGALMSRLDASKRPSKLETIELSRSTRFTGVSHASTTATTTLAPVAEPLGQPVAAECTEAVASGEAMEMTSQNGNLAPRPERRSQKKLQPSSEGEQQPQPRRRQSAGRSPGRSSRSAVPSGKSVAPAVPSGRHIGADAEMPLVKGRRRMQQEAEAKAKREADMQARGIAYRQRLADRLRARQAATRLRRAAPVTEGEAPNRREFPRAAERGAQRMDVAGNGRRPSPAPPARRPAAGAARDAASLLGAGPIDAARPSSKRTASNNNTAARTSAHTARTTTEDKSSPKLPAVPSARAAGGLAAVPPPSSAGRPGSRPTSSAARERSPARSRPVSSHSGVAGSACRSPLLRGAGRSIMSS
eukprot:TRINITY_DN44312_c0_g1_i1.p1 TRINITY_DN44312_c0_g1~~TRINITY_DN44312_c0_g1_i1.p1  ORF type:complete len:802 (+),score=144.74 TRINITY_DN44312_c0_g1_i1:164-2569(+)